MRTQRNAPPCLRLALWRHRGPVPDYSPYSTTQRTVFCLRMEESGRTQEFLVFYGPDPSHVTPECALRLLLDTAMVGRWESAERFLTEEEALSNYEGGEEMALAIWAYGHDQYPLLCSFFGSEARFRAFCEEWT